MVEHPAPGTRHEGPAAKHLLAGGRRGPPGSVFAFSLVTGAVVLLIQGYQLALRPLLVGCCKFQPTCSDYAAAAIQTHGLWHGGLLAARRILRCHPFAPGGIDPVP